MSRRTSKAKDQWWILVCRSGRF